jgi:tRNA threonylcarbamoyladenosine biosynthesis protein TsaB
MKVLAIDTATTCGVIGIGEHGRPVAEISLVSRENHSARLLPSVDWLLTMAGWKIEEIDGFGVTLGPGSFTGLRVGLSTIKGLAWALKKPVAGLNSLEVLACQVRAEREILVPMLDARKGRVYGAAYRWSEGSVETLLPPGDVPVSELISGLRGSSLLCFGEGARKYRAEIEAVGRSDVAFAPPEYDLPRGATISRVTFEALSRSETLDIGPVEPTYLRASEAELKRKEAEATS